MSNLSELLPTGGGQNAVDFVASGTLSSGQAVVLNSDGTVEAAGFVSIPEDVGTPSVFSGNYSSNISSTFDSNANKVVIAYRDGLNSSYGTAIVGTVSGTSISFGTPAVFESAQSRYISATFDSSSNKIVIAYSDFGNSFYGTAVVGTVSGTSISFGSPAVFSTSQMEDFISTTFDSSQNKVVIAYANASSGGRGEAVVGTVSGVSISFGSSVIFDTGDSQYIAATFDSNSNKVAIAYRDGNNSRRGTVIVGTVSGTSISFGTPVVFNSDTTNWISATFDTNANKVVIAYFDDGNAGRGTAIVGTVSGTSISFGSSVVFHNTDSRGESITFDANANKIVIAYQDTDNSSYGRVIAGTVSGTSISFDTSTVFESASVNEDWISTTFDSSTNKVVIAYEDASNLSSGTTAVFQNASTGTNSADFIGITAGAISDTATGAVNVYGGINESQSGLTIGSDYYVQADGSLSTTASDVKVGQAISATTINMMDLT